MSVADYLFRRGRRAASGRSYTAQCVGLTPLQVAAAHYQNRSSFLANGDSVMMHELPPLPYAYNALEPYIDAVTMRLHHQKHHAGYVENLNKALAPHAELRDRSAAWLLANLQQLPEDIRTAVQRNAGGHLNHSVFWQTMLPAKDFTPPVDSLASAIERDFGSLGAMQEQFDTAGKGLFGAGWVWLVRNRNGRLEIVTTAGHDTPMPQGLTPLVLNDVWEHAYYLHYQNRRAEYLNLWWNIVNWPEVMRRHDESNHQF